MNNKECEVCSKMVKEKYKNFKIWRTLAIVFICTTVLFAILYFANGNIIVEENIENNIIVENTDGDNENNIITGDSSQINKEG